MFLIALEKILQHTIAASDHQILAQLKPQLFNLKTTNHQYAILFS